MKERIFVTEDKVLQFGETEILLYDEILVDDTVVRVLASTECEYGYRLDCQRTDGTSIHLYSDEGVLQKAEAGTVSLWRWNEGKINRDQRRNPWD